MFVCNDIKDKTGLAGRPPWRLKVSWTGSRAILALFLAALVVGSAPVSWAEDSVVSRFVVPVPYEVAGAARILVAGVTPYNVTVDANGNGIVDPEEETLQVYGRGEVALLTLRLPENLSADAVVSLLVSGGPASVFVYSVDAGGVLAYTAPKPGTLLLPPPGGTLLIANPGPEVARVRVGGEEILVAPLQVVRVCLEGEEAVVESNVPVVAVAFGRHAGDWWAAEVVPAEEAVRYIGASSLQLGAETRVLVRYASGAWEAYNAESLVDPYVLPGDAAVYYVAYGNGIGVAPGVARGPLEGPGLLVSPSGLVLGGDWVVAVPGTPREGYLLYDRNGDGRYEVILFLDTIARTWVYAGEDRYLALYTDRGAPLILEQGGPGLALYTYTFPATGTLDAATLQELLGNQYMSVQYGGTGEIVNITVRVTPRSDYGGVTSAAAVLFDTRLDPVPGSAAPLEPDGEGGLYGVVSAPASVVEEGAYLVAAVAYQEGAGISSVPVATADKIVRPTTMDPLPCSDQGPASDVSVRVESLAPEPYVSRRPPTIGDLDLGGLGDLIASAAPEPVQPTVTTTGTAGPAPVPTSPELTPIPVEEGRGGSPITFYAAVVVALIVVIVIVAGSKMRR